MTLLQHINKFHDTLSSRSEAVASVISLESVTTTRVIQVHFSLQVPHTQKWQHLSKIMEYRPEFFTDYSVLTNLTYSDQGLLYSIMLINAHTVFLQPSYGWRRD